MDSTIVSKKKKDTVYKKKGERMKKSSSIFFFFFLELNSIGNVSVDRENRTTSNARDTMGR